MSALAPRPRLAVGSLIIWVGCFLLGSMAQASIAPLQVRPGRISPPIRAGAIAGGQAEDEFSILGIKTVASGASNERLVISYGDRNGRPIKGEPGFFHVALDRHSKRIIIDLAQVSRTAIDSKDLSRILSSSRLIANSDMTMDPQDGSTNITLTLRAPVQMSVLSEAGQQGRLVIDLQAARAGSEK